MNKLTYRETLSSVDLLYECTNTLKTLGRAEQCRANVLTYKETLPKKARLINGRAYLRTEKCCEDDTQRETMRRKTIVRT